MTKLHHTSELIGSLEYGSLKKAKIIPSTTMFTAIPKLGGKFPKLASKVDAWWFGYYMDRIVRMVLQEREFKPQILENARVEVAAHTEDEQCDAKQASANMEYYTDIATWLLGVVPDVESEYEPEWTSGQVMGHPDLVIGDTIYDVKTTGRWGRMRIRTIFQLLSYAALSQVNGKHIKYIGVILPAQQIIERYDISKWNGSKYLELLNEKARERDQVSDVDPKMLIEFSVIQPHIGSHVKRERTLRKTLETLNSNQPIQIFLGTRMSLDHKFADTDISKSLTYIQENDMRVFVHTPYTINIARDVFNGRRSGEDVREINDVLIEHLQTTASFGGSGVVVHVGKQADMTREEALDNMCLNVMLAAAFATPECPLLIETDSGGSLIDDPSDLAQFWLDLDENIRDNVAICFDTCHVFAAGYDNLDMLLMFREKGVPVRLIHFNDSKFAKGTKKDYHASFGHGLVGCEELISVAKYATAMNIPMVTE